LKRAFRSIAIGALSLGVFAMFVDAICVGPLIFLKCLMWAVTVAFVLALCYLVGLVVDVLVFRND
jgi:hypothetical protein